MPKSHIPEWVKQELAKADEAAARGKLEQAAQPLAAAARANWGKGGRPRKPPCCRHESTSGPAKSMVQPVPAHSLLLAEVRQLHEGINSLLLELAAISKKSEESHPPIGLILSAGKCEEHVEPLQLSQSNTRVAGYLTLLRPRETLQAKPHQSIELARLKLQSNSLAPGEKYEKRFWPSQIKHS